MPWITGLGFQADQLRHRAREEQMAKASMSEGLTRLFEVEIDNEHIVHVVDFGRAADGRLFFAQEFLDGNLPEKVTLCGLATASGLPPFRLLRAFQEVVGLTPHAYQTQARIRMALAMLRRQAPLADVAAATGFADQPHFTRVFKSIMGATPQQYRSGVATGLPT